MNNDRPTHRHRKSGNFYWLIARGHDCTNAHGRLVPVVIYRNAIGWWVREAAEFDEGFEELTHE